MAKLFVVVALFAIVAVALSAEEEAKTEGEQKGMKHDLKAASSFGYGGYGLGYGYGGGYGGFGGYGYGGGYGGYLGSYGGFGGYGWGLPSYGIGWGWPGYGFGGYGGYFG